jgi:nucleoside-diphosphate-sugar epimerase
MTNVGITGATGMIGKNLVSLLTSSEELRHRYRTVALVREVSRTVELERWGVEQRRVDYGAAEGFRDGIADLQVIVHLAGVTQAYRTADFYRANTAGTRNLLEAVSRYGTSVRHFLFSSSLAACGPAHSPSEPREEEAECTPESRYGESKLRAEGLIRCSGVDWTVLRLPMVLGPHDYEGLRLFRLVRTGWAFTFGRGPDYFSWVCAQDLAAVFVALMLNPSAYGEVINVCYDGVVPAPELYGNLRTAMGLDPGIRILHLPRWSAFAVGLAASLVQRVCRRPGYVNLDKAWELTGKYMVLSNRKMKEKLKMDHFVESGALAETVRWFRSRGLL